MSKPLRMHQIKRIIELHHQGNSIRQTARLTGLSRNTVREYLHRIKQSGLCFTELLSLDDVRLSNIVYVDAIEKATAGRAVDDRHTVLSPLIDYYCSELRKRGVTRMLVWQEYRKNNQNGYGYTQFCAYLNQHLVRDKAVMHFTHIPAESLQVDFAGDKLGYVDRTTGELILCEVLVCALPYSHYVYAEALHSQKQEDFIKGLGRCLEYIGGVPQSITCDNMRTAVVKANRYEPIFTEAMEYVGEHYGTTILATRVRKPRDKASVEKAVDLSYKYIYAPLRDQTFYSVDELNAAISKQVEQLNDRSFTKKPGSRRQLFEADEKHLLKPLPSSLYEIKHVTQGKVQRNYHVIVGEDGHQYSVPFTLIGKRLKIIYTADTVEIYDNLKRVALHKRSYRKNGYTTCVDHRPPNHKHVEEQRAWDDEYFLRNASYIGQSVQQVVKRILESKVFYEQTYNSCLGILHLAKKCGNQRLEAACKRALTSPKVNYGMVANILKNHLDKAEDEQPVQTTLDHPQIRGSQSYQ